jgi:hypothetical protein
MNEKDPCTALRPASRPRLAEAFSLLALACLALPAWGQMIEARLSPARSSVRIGEALPATLSLSYEGRLEPLPLSLPPRLGPWELLSQGKTDSSAASGALRMIRIPLTLICFDTGLQRIAPLAIAYREAGRPDTLFTYSEGQQVEVFPMPVSAEEDIRPIKALREVPASWLDYWPWGLGALALGLGLWLLWRYLRRRKAAPAVAAPTVPALAPAEAALQALAALEARKAWRGPAKAFYIELTDILRTYLQGQFGIAAAESVTSEILEETARIGLPSESPSQLARILEQADLVKFAKLLPPEAESASLLALARAFVEASRPAAVPEPSAPSSARPA